MGLLPVKHEMIGWQGVYKGGVFNGDVVANGRCSAGIILCHPFLYPYLFSKGQNRRKRKRPLFFPEKNEGGM